MHDKSMYTIEYDQLMAWQEDAKNRTLDIYNPSHHVPRHSSLPFLGAYLGSDRPA
jgi:hypothetical protein